MIRGAVDDPTLTLDNHEIARRHVTAFLLQRYHQAKLPEIDREAQPHLFAVLGTVLDFRTRRRVLNRPDLEGWLRSNAAGLKADVAAGFRARSPDLIASNSSTNSSRAPCSRSMRRSSTIQAPLATRAR